MGSESVATLDQIMSLQHHPDCHKIPCAVKNFKIYLNRSQAAADHLQLLIESDGIMMISNKEIDEETLVLRKVKGILNKLTESNYQKMLDSLCSINQIRNDDTLNKLVDVVITNIKTSLHFVSLYAVLARDIDMRNLWHFSDKKFSMALQRRCIQEFRKFQTSEERAVVQAQLDEMTEHDVRFEKETLIRKHNNAIIMFLAHMFRNNLTHIDNIVRVLQHLLRPLPDQQFIDSYNVDFFISVYPVVAVKISHVNPSLLRDIHDCVCKVKADTRLETRHNFMLDDVMESVRRSVRPIR